MSQIVQRGLTSMSKRMGLAIETIEVLDPTQADGWCEDRVSFLAWHAAETAINMVWEAAIKLHRLIVSFV